MSSLSKDAQCDLLPDATRRPPGLLRGRSALPSAPHLDGQSDCGLRQRSVPVGETETAVPKCTPQWELLRGGKSLNLWPLSLSFTPPPPPPPPPSPLTLLSHHCPSTEETPELNLKLFFSAFSSGATHLSRPTHVSTPSPRFSFVITITLQYVKEQKQITAFVLFFLCEDFEFRAGTFSLCVRTSGPWLMEALTKYDERKGKWEHHFRVVHEKQEHTWSLLLL